MKRIVIIDDEYMVVEGLKTLIDWTEHDAQVIGCAHNGAKGLELIMKEKPDIIFTDIKMPVMNGLTMIDNARKQGFDGIFIIFSGYNEFTYAREALSLGVISYIEKPVTIEQINNAMKKACRIFDTKARNLMPSDKADSLSLETATSPDDWAPAKSPFVKQLFSNTSKIWQAIQKCDEDQLLSTLDTHFRILEESNASSIVILHECLRLMYIALSELRDDESDFVSRVMQGTPPFVELSRLNHKSQFRPWLTGRLLDVINWIREKNHSQKHIFVIQAREYLDAHFAEAISLQQLADVVHINAAYLSTLFKKEVGISYVKYLTDLRLTEARKRLLDGERVGIVCQEVGFKDGRHFAKLYKEKYGITPDREKKHKQ